MRFVSYAQNFEDVRLWRAFTDIGSGRYLDIGTQDPVQDSVSLAFYERGWRGVHVEPTPTYAAAIRAARPDETVIEAAVTTAPGPIRFFEIPSTGLSTGELQIAERHKAAGWQWNEIAVATVSLAGLFDHMGPDPIHWLKIDVEGMEADVLASWGPHPARPAVLVIEATAPSTQMPSHEAWVEMVLARGYTEVLFDGLSRYFVHEDHADRGEAIAISPNVFDGFQVCKGHFTAQLLVEELGAEVEAVRQQATSNSDMRIASVAAALEQAEAQYRIAVAGSASQLEAAKAETARIGSKLNEETQAYTTSLAEAREQIAASEQALATANNRLSAEQDALSNATFQLEALRQAHLALTRERGRLEGQLASLEQAYAARLADAEAIRSDLDIRLDQAENALVTANTRILSTAASLSDAEKRLTELQQDHKALVQENWRLEGQLSAQADAHALRLVEADQVQQDLMDSLGRTENALASAQSEAGRLAGELANLAEKHDVGQREAAASQEALGRDLKRLTELLVWRDQQLSRAAALLEAVPKPRAGLPPLVAALADRLRGRATIAAIEEHAQESMRWRADLLLSSASNSLHGTNCDGAEASQIAATEIEYGGIETMASDEPVTSVPKLLARHDRQFIHTAYQAVLGRAPDAAGEAYYLFRLRAGTHKLEILKQLRNSPEGRAFIPGVAGLDRATKRHRWATMPIVGAIIRLFTGWEGNGTAHRQLRVIVNDVERVRSEVQTGFAQLREIVSSSPAYTNDFSSGTSFKVSDPTSAPKQTSEYTPPKTSQVIRNPGSTGMMQSGQVPKFEMVSRIQPDVGFTRRSRILYAKLSGLTNV